ncbi:MAG: phenylacetate--CoA ligase family protein [Chloroflexota bacterium]
MGNDYFDQLETRSRQEREDYLNRRLREQVSYAYENAPAMKAKLDQAGVRPSDIRTIKDLEKLPITSKGDLIRLRKESPPWGGLLGVPPYKLPRVFMSPGPIYDTQSLSDDFYRRFQRGFYCIGFRQGDLVVNTWNYHMVPSGHWVDESLRRLGCTVIPMGVGNTELQVQVLKDMKVAGWAGGSSFLMSIYNKAEELGYNPRRDFSLRVAWAGGEMGGGPIRKTLEEKYGLITGDMYPTADVGLISYECSEKSGMHICEETVVEISDPTTGKQLGAGEVGEVVVTPFDNTYPLIRFGTGDLSSLIEEPCPCGRTSLKLTRLLGRVGDIIRVRGIFLYPGQMREVTAKCPEIVRYQAVVTRPQFKDELVLKVELNTEAVDKDALATAIRDNFQNVCRLKIDRLEFVCKGTIPDGAKAIVDERVY